MRECANLMIGPYATIREAIAVIEKESAQIALVAGPDCRLLGTVTDGDVRRGILDGLSLEQPVERVMNAKPSTIVRGTPWKTAYDLMLGKGLRRIPVLSPDGIIAGMEALEDYLKPHPRENSIVIMAGGLGSRLAPLTKDCPKPLLKVGSKPLLETILESLIAYSFRKFYFSVNYKADMIESYFGDGSRWGVRIEYLREEEPLGTAGALSLLPSIPEQPLIVINGDLLTSLNFAHLLHYHQEHAGLATMCIREYAYSIPYGVVDTDQHRFLGIREKPVHRTFVNAGIYVLEPRILAAIPRSTYTDMTALFEQLAAHDEKLAVFPVQEYWLDIGKMDDYERANREYGEVFP
ncbi:nucleotidyltransferase family protein [Paenibacillus sp. GCM10012307]|uniref:Nucleotidyltransferase family protein n=1 Tax=Paenibacillus roseus TaxID=2798579 RepID=A0A934MMI6_9BACL|nr:nucleotidyltransferase family protein [Paenibacillus roseus]MBJ6359981.1 nucleotidyltransferase family protein [Paenibacillus roseus]